MTLTRSPTKKSTNSAFGLNRLNLSQKFTLILISLLLPIALLFAILLINANQTIAFTEQEVSGIQFITPLRHLAQHLAEHRGMTNAYRSGNKAMKGKLVKKKQVLDRDFATLDKISNRLGKDLRATAPYRDIRKRWYKLRDELERLTAQESIERHTELIADVLNLIGHVADTSNLIIDPELKNAYLTDLIIHEIPHLTETTGVLRAVSSSVAAKRVLSDNARLKLHLLSDKVLELADGVEKAVSIIIADAPDLEAELATRGKQVPEASRSYVRRISEQVIHAQPIDVDSSAIFDEGTAAIDAAFDLFDGAVQALTGRLRDRIAREKQQAIFEFAAILAFVSVAVLFTLYISRSITVPLGKAVMAFGKIEKGNYNTPITPQGTDEISRVQHGLLKMQNKLKDDAIKRERQNIALGRIQSALEYIETPVTVSDGDGVLLFMNRSCRGLFQEFIQERPQHGNSADVSSLIGRKLLDFFEDDRLRSIFQASLKESREAEFTIHGRTFLLTISPIYDSQGGYQGRVTQWMERTEQLKTEQEIQSVVDAARAGDLSQQVVTDNKSGFFLAFSNSINQLLEINRRFTDELGSVLSALAQGDLSKTVNGSYQGQFNLLKESTNQTIDRLREVISELLDSAREIAQSTREIAANNQDLSARTEKQAASLEQTASAMEEITSMVLNTAESVTAANELARSTRDLGTRGDRVLADAITSMEEIDNASQKIEKIISVINEIAFQTNLLALNASVEAAHAGDQGKGFAVVATEVRNLAQRSAQAAKEIKTLIEDSGAKVSQGSMLVRNSGQALGEIVTSVNKVGDLLDEIANAGSEQSKGIEEVNRAIASIDAATQSNTAMVEQTAAASHELEKHARRLAEVTGFFNIGADSPFGAGMNKFDGDEPVVTESDSRARVA